MDTDIGLQKRSILVMYAHSLKVSEELPYMFVVIFTGEKRIWFLVNFSVCKLQLSFNLYPNFFFIFQEKELEMLATQYVSTSA